MQVSPCCNQRVGVPWIVLVLHRYIIHSHRDSICEDFMLSYQPYSWLYWVLPNLILGSLCYKPVLQLVLGLQNHWFMDPITSVGQVCMGLFLGPSFPWSWLDMAIEGVTWIFFLLVFFSPCHRLSVDVSEEVRCQLFSWLRRSALVWEFRLSFGMLCSAYDLSTKKRLFLSKDWITSTIFLFCHCSNFQEK